MANGAEAVRDTSNVTIHRVNLAYWLHSGPDDDDLFYPWLRLPESGNHGGVHPHPTHRPRLATICRWCMERTVSTVFYDLHHPDFRHLCHECRLDARMFIQRLAMHRAMTDMQATRAVIELMDLDNRVLPE